MGLLKIGLFILGAWSNNHVFLHNRISKTFIDPSNLLVRYSAWIYYGKPLIFLEITYFAIVGYDGWWCICTGWLQGAQNSFGGIITTLLPSILGFCFDFLLEHWSLFSLTGRWDGKSGLVTNWILWWLYLQSWIRIKNCIFTNAIKVWFSCFIQCPGPGTAYLRMFLCLGIWW